MNFYANDVAQMMDPAEFALVASTIGGDLSGILVEPYTESLGMVSGSKPVLVVSSDSLAVISPAVGDSITVGGRSFAIVGFEPDGTGVTRIVLERH